MSEGIEFNIVDESQPEIGTTFCAHVDDYPAIVDGKEVLEDPDTVLIPMRTLQLKVTYPLNSPQTFPVLTENPRGFTRKELFRVIYETYVKIFKDAKKYGVWGHRLDHLFLESAFLASPGVVELGIGS